MMGNPTPVALAESPPAFSAQPFYDETVALLHSVRDHDFATLAGLCDDDFGIVDIDVDGSAHPIRNRAEWEEWFTRLFATLEGMNAETDSVILDYQARREGRLGFGVLEFRQTLTVGAHVATFDCVATIVWKLTPQGWREARWHASIISSDVPAALQRVA
jgi:hypothetical protein